MSTRRIRICVEQMTGLVFSGPHSLTIERSWRGLSTFDTAFDPSILP